jgi:type III secretion protein Q
MGRFENLIAPGVTVTPFVWPALPIISADAALFAVRAYGVARTTIHRLGGKDVAVTGPLRPSLFMSGTSIGVRFGDKDLTVLAPAGALGTLLAVMGIHDDWRHYGVDAAAMVVEHLLGDLLRPVEAALGGPFHVTGVAACSAQPEGASLVLDVAISGMPDQTLRIFATADVLAKVAAVLAGPDQPEHKPDLSHIAFPIRLMGPSFTVTAADIAASVVGDGFVLTLDWDGLGTARLMVADQLCATTRRSAHGFTLTSPIARRELISESEGDTMLTKTATAPTRDDALPVTMAIELARTTITLADLRDMAPGHLLPFASDLPAEVRLLANGKPYGRGELVRVDGKVAVRLTKIG